MSVNSGKRLYLSSPHMSGDEQKYIKEAFEQNWVAPLGPNVNEFEKELAAFCGVNHAAALSSGTAAIHLSLIMHEVGPGDSVLCQSFTFGASAFPITYQGARPIFIDSEEETWNMSPELLEKAIKNELNSGRKPKAIIPVHLYGMIASMEEINEIAHRYEIPVIEDAAEALGSSLNKQMAGSFGKMAVLSFNGNKIITTSGGGALISNDEALINKARFLATQARDPAPHYEHTQVGYNYRMSNIVAGIGRGQLEVITERVNRRREIFEIYKKELQDFEGISFLEEPSGSYSNRWLTTILVDRSKTGFSNDELRLALEEENIESRPLWKPMHLQPVFKDTPSYNNGVSERLFNCGLCLPSGSNMTEEDVERVLKIIEGLRS